MINNIKFSHSFSHASLAAPGYCHFWLVKIIARTLVVENCIKTAWYNDASGYLCAAYAATRCASLRSGIGIAGDIGLDI